MANNNLKFDLGSTVRQVAELNQALQALGQVAQTLFSNLGTLSEAFGSKVANAAQNVQQTTGQSNMLTPTGNQQAANVIRDRFMNKIIRSDLESNSGKYMVADGNVMERVVTAGGTTWKSTGRTAEGVFRNESASQAMVDAVNRSTPPPTTTSAPMPMQSYKNAPGYSLADIPRLAAAQGGVGGIGDNLSKSIEALSKSNVEQNRALAGVLDKIKNDLNSNNDKFTQLFREYTSKSALDPTSDEYKEYMARLTEAMKSLEGSIDASNEAQKNAGAIIAAGGGGGTGMLGRLGGMAQRWGGFAGSLIGAGAGVMSGYYSTTLDYERAIHGKQLEQGQLAGQFVQGGWANIQRTFDINNAENFLRAHGDKLLPGEFQFMGGAGRNRAMMLGGEMVKDIREQQRLERESGFWGHIGGAVLGTGKIIGGIGATAMSGGLGAAPGLGLAAWGISDLVSAGRGLVGGQVGSAYTAAEGGLERGLTGAAGRALVGEDKYNRLAPWARHAELARDQMMSQQFADQFSEAELRARQPLVDATQSALDAQAARRAAARLVGGSRVPSITGYSAVFNQIAEKTKEADQLSAQLESYRSNLRTGATDVTPAGWEGETEQRIASLRLEAGNMAKESLPWVRYGETMADWVGKGATLTSAMRGQIANNRQIGLLTQMEYAGLGGFNENAEAVRSIGGVAGGTGGQNLSAFVKAMSSAVAIGFDDSRMSKRFVESTTELARSVGATNTSSVAGMTALTAQLIKGEGKVSELELNKALEGAQAFAQFTGQRGGFQGLLKLGAAHGAGITFGRGAGIVQGMNSMQMMSWLSDLEQGRTPTDPAYGILARERGEGGKPASIAQMKEHFRNITRDSTSSYKAWFNQAAGARGGKSFDESIQEIRGLKGNKRNAAIRQFIDRMSIGVSDFGEGNWQEGAAAAAQILNTEGGVSIIQGKQILDNYLKTNVEKGIDQGKVARERSLASYMAGPLANITGPVSKQDYFAMQQAGLFVARSGNIPITKEEYERAEKGAKAGISSDVEALKNYNKQIENISRAELIQAQAQESLYRGEQKVWVSNWHSLETMLNKTMKGGKVNPNIGN